MTAKTTIRSRLLAGYLATMLVTGLSVAVFVQIVAGARVDQGLRDKGEFIAETVAERSVAPFLADDRLALAELVLEVSRVDDDVEYVFLCDQQGRVLAHSFPHGFPATLAHLNRLGPGRDRSVREIDTNRGPVLDVAVPLMGGAAGAVHLGLSQEYMSAAFAQLSHQLWALMLVLIVCGSGVAVLEARSISRPIIQLRDGVQAVGRGDLAQRLPAAADDEIGDLAGSFNEMASRLALSRREVDLATRELEAHSHGLELRVAERTAALEQANARLRQEIRERARAEQEARSSGLELAHTNEELTALYALSSSLQRVVGPDEMCRLVLDVVTDLAAPRGDGRAAIFLSFGDELRLVAQVGHDAGFDERHEHLQVGQCLCGAAAKAGRVIVYDRCADSRHTLCHPPGGEHGHVIVPLRAAGGPIGVLSMYTGGDPEPRNHHRHFLQAMGEQIGTAIHNARAYQSARDDSLHDPLTGLANRRHLEVALRQSFTEARRYGHPLSLVMMDIDHFKRFNDTFGHSAGDRLLLDVSRLLRQDLRETDLAVRYGGEEFLLLMPETMGARALEVAERLRTRIASRTQVTVSLGIASFHPAQGSPNDLVNDADDAMYEAKRRGRNRSVRSDRPRPDGREDHAEAPASAQPS